MSTTVLPVLAAERTTTRPYVALGGLQVLDVLTTFAILTWFAAGRVEGNPIAAAVFSSAGLAVGCLVLLVFKMAVVGLFYACQTKVRFASAIYGIVVVNNLLLLGLAVLR